MDFYDWVTQHNPPFDWKLWAHTKAAYEFKVFQPKNNQVRFTSDMSMSTSGPILNPTGGGSVDCNDDISVLYLHNSLSSEDRTSSHAKREYKNNHGIFSFTSVPSILTPCTIYHKLNVFQTKQEEKHEAKQHAKSPTSAWGFPDKVKRSREDHHHPTTQLHLISKCSALAIGHIFWRVQRGVVWSVSWKDFDGLASLFLSHHLVRLLFFLSENTNERKGRETIADIKK